MDVPLLVRFGLVSMAARTRLALGWALLRDGDAESAIREWRDAAGKADLETQALALLAVADVALRQGREGEALEALRGVAAAPPGLRPTPTRSSSTGASWPCTRQAYADAIQTLEPLAPADRGYGRIQHHLLVGGLLAVEDVTRRFGGIVALADVSLALEKGQIVGLIGPNGAGKTTLFNCVSRLVQPARGRDRLRRRGPAARAPHEIVRARDRAHVPEPRALPRADACSRT